MGVEVETLKMNVTVLIAGRDVLDTQAAMYIDHPTLS
jgi:hypothetical protein